MAAEVMAAEVMALVGVAFVNKVHHENCM